MLQSPSTEKCLSTLGRLGLWCFCKAGGKQRSESLLHGVFIVAAVCLGLLFCFGFMGRTCENTLTKDLRFCDTAKEFAFIYSPPLPAFTKTERGMGVRRRARIPPHFRHQPYGPGPIDYLRFGVLIHQVGIIVYLVTSQFSRSLRQKCKSLVFLLWMTYAEFLQACLEYTLLTTQKDLSRWVFQGTNLLLTKKPKWNMVLVSCSGCCCRF